MKDRFLPMAASVLTFLGIASAGGFMLYTFRIDHLVAWILVGAAGGAPCWFVWRSIRHRQRTDTPVSPAAQPPPAQHPRRRSSSALTPKLPYDVHFRRKTAASSVAEPSSATGSEPLEYLLTGHEIGLAVSAVGPDPVTFSELRAEVIARRTFSDELSIGLHPGIDLEVPHFEILLDTEPPLIRRALRRNGTAARQGLDLPITVQPGDTSVTFLSPLTNDSRFIDWMLTATLVCQGRSSTYSIPFRVTAHTGWIEASPGGSVRDIKGAEWAKRNGHWTIQESQ